MPIGISCAEKLTCEVNKQKGELTNSMNVSHYWSLSETHKQLLLLIAKWWHFFGTRRKQKPEHSRGRKKNRNRYSNEMRIGAARECPFGPNVGLKKGWPARLCADRQLSGRSVTAYARRNAGAPFTASGIFQSDENNWRTHAMITGKDSGTRSQCRTKNVVNSRSDIK